MAAKEARITRAFTEKGILIVGGGVAGIQAALDLAKAGAKVYLVERSPSLGGRMAQLDKTLPTNDCSICILSPLLVECARHERIELLTLAEVETLSGTVGDFTAEIVTHPRYVDASKCTGCGDCEPACPVKIRDEFEMGLKTQKAVYRPYPQAVPNVYSIMKGKEAPCNAACPAGINVKAYVSLVGSGKFREAYDIIGQAMPFPSVCGRVCYSPCEEACNRCSFDGAVAIRALKRFVSDYVNEHRCETASDERPDKPEVRTDHRVAVIGSGPAGMTAAWKLTGLGYPVTVFEAMDRPGGMMRVGIPRYRLPDEVLDSEIDAICDMGVELRLGERIDDAQALLHQGYKAVCVATGAHKTPALDLDGENLKGVMHALAFLRDVNLGRSSEVRGKVVVIGGGNAAVDAARTALRLGAEAVHIVYRRTRQEMPAYHAEIEAALDEGVELSLLVGPVGMTGSGKRLKQVRLIRMELGEPDASGRPRPIPVPGTEFNLDADLVLLATSQRADSDCLSGKTPIRKDGTVEVDAITLKTPIEGIFAAGDVATGPNTVVDAIRAGSEAALSIHRYLSGMPLGEGREIAECDLAEAPDMAIPGKPRTSLPTIPIRERTRGFSEVELALSPEAAIDEASRCLGCGLCCSCMECVKACEADAIIHDDEPGHLSLDVAAVVVATGFDEMDPTPIRNLSYGEQENILTGLEFERMLNAAGPTRGRVVKPSDGKPPRSIALIQCVGSRDERYNPYCSRVCCVYSIKQCMVAKDHEPSVDGFYYFYRDLRACGRGFEEYCTRGREETGITLVRSSPSSIAAQGDGGLAVRYEDPETAKPASVTVDMVVLACAMKPRVGTSELAQALGIEIDSDGFFKIAEPLLDPVSSTREGILVCGCAAGPRDIPDSVAQASAASAKALAFLGKERRPLEDQPLPKTDPDEEPRVGIFVCHCGLNIGRVVDSKAVADYARGLPGVAYAEDNLYTCSDDTQKRIADTIRREGLNRVIVAACTPRTHEPIFRQTCAQAGLNPYLFEMANIRDQCSWVHSDLPEDATGKAKDLVRMALARAKLLRPLERKRVEVERSALVVGGGPAGIQCAIDIARLGIPVHLIEKEPALGGQLRSLDRLFPSETRACDVLKAKIQELEGLPVRVTVNAKLESIEGFVGNFDVSVNGGDFRVGAVVLATGGTTLVPEGRLGYRRVAGVITSGDFEKMLADSDSFGDATSIAFIQCVGAREREGYTGCSRYCCQVTLKQALEARDKGAAVVVIHRDIRAFTRYGEDLYRRARLAGINFIRMRSEDQIKVDGNGDSSSLTVFDETLLTEITLRCDHVVLAVPLLPSATVQDLSEMLRVPVGLDGFFLERHVKLGPLETNTEGIFLCGCAQYPKDIPDTLAQASGVAAKVGILLSRPYVTLDPATATVRSELCRACGTCVEICEYNAPEIIEEGQARYAVINEALCKGCGTCAAHCPTGAIIARHFTAGQIEAMIDDLFSGKS
jgi:heterodisulfide reductase subunit A-like polyferredoxin